MLNAVGIDVSKGKSTVAVLRPAGEVVRKPFNGIMTAMKILSVKSSLIQLMLRKSLSTLLTNGSFCVSIQLWIRLEHN